MKKMLKDKNDKPHREGFFELMSRLNTQSKSKDDERPENPDKINLDKKDMLALVLSAFFTLFLPAILILVLIVCIVLAIFGVFS